MIIDFHVHIYPESVAAKILPAAEKKLKITVPCAGSPDDLRYRMKSSGISKSIVLPLARGQEDVSSLNDWIQSVSGDGLLAFGAIHPLMDGLEAELNRLKGWGVKGVKMMPLLQGFYPDDPRCGRLYDALIDSNMILMTHSGQDPLDRREVFGTPKHFSEMIKSYPELNLVLAHLGGLRMWDDVCKYLLPASGNVCFDTSYVSFYMSKAELERLIRDINSLDLSENEKEAVLWRNAARLLNRQVSRPEL